MIQIIRKYDHAKQFKKPKDHKVEFITGVILVLIFIYLMSQIDGRICSDVVGGVCI